jgi:ATP-dependent helicase/nuclease subunit A
MRLLYVALTRAQDKLILTVPLGMTKTGNPFAKAAAFLAAGAGETLNQQAGSFADWLRAALLVHPFGGPLRRLAGDLELPFVFTESEIMVTVQEAQPEPETPEQEPEAAEPVPADPALVAQLQEGFAWRYPAAKLAAVPAKVSVSAVAHAARPVALERPAFLQKTGMTGAERGTAIHAFMQSVPFDGPAPDLDAEVRRQTDLQLLDPALADKLDLDAVRPFFASAVWRRIRLAKHILREEPFITALPAAEVTPAAGQGSAAAAEVLVQGIADLVLVFDEHAEILDYKTDRSRDAQYYIDEYAAQLRLYRRAFAQRLAVPVTKLTIYSFAIEDEIDVPLG